VTYQYSKTQYRCSSIWHGIEDYIQEIIIALLNTLLFPELNIQHNYLQF